MILRVLTGAALLAVPWWATAQFEPIGPPPGSTSAEDLPEVVATVAGEPITRETYLQALNTATQRLMANPHVQQQGISMLNSQQQRMVLEALINNRVAGVLAEEAGITVEDAAVDAFIAREQARFPSPDVFDEFLRNAGMSRDDLRNQTREMLRVQAYGEQVTGEITISPEEVREQYEALRDEGRLNAPKTWDFRHILIKLDPADPDSSAEAEQAIGAIRERIEAGADFGAVAEEVSDDLNSREAGGHYRNVPKGRGMFDDSFEEVAFSLAEGELSKPFVTRMGWHLVAMEKVHEAGLMSFERVEDSLGMQLIARKQQAFLQRHLAEARGRVPVEIHLDFAANGQTPAATDILLRQLEGGS